MTIIQIFMILILVYTSTLLVEIYYSTTQVNKDNSTITWPQIAIKSLLTTLLAAMFLFGYDFILNKAAGAASSD
jgi:hypothetical protein